MSRDAYPAEATVSCQIGLISWPYALRFASRDARQASNSIFAEKTIAGRWGKRALALLDAFLMASRCPQSLSAFLSAPFRRLVSLVRDTRGA